MIINDYVYYATHGNQLKNITIFTDSNFVCNVMNINGYPEFDDHYRLLSKIFRLISKLIPFNINIEIVKIPSHCGIDENRIVDHIAKEAASIAKQCKYGKSNYMVYNCYYNPVHVDISIDLKRLRYKHYQDRKREWEIKNRAWKMNQLDENYYKGNMIFYKMLFSHNNILKESQMK